MRYFIITLIFVILLSAPALAERDFGLRSSAGALTDNGRNLYDIEVNLDFLFFSHFNMTIGSAYIIPTEDITPPNLINYIGIEYNHPLGENRAVLGINYNKSFLKHSDFEGKHGWRGYAGMKYNWLPNIDFAVLFGAATQPLVASDDAINKELSDTIYFIKGAFEIYY